MSYPDRFACTGRGFGWEVGGGHSDLFHDHKSNVEDEDIMLEQFTGLLDKSGKEIYEGDIVDVDKLNHSWADNPWRGSIVWHDASWAIARLDSSSPQFVQMWQDKIVVIGNIHEHTNLLSNP